MKPIVLLLIAAFSVVGCKETQANPPPAQAAAPKPAAPPAQGEDWNDAQIAWKGYDEGLAAAAQQNKPVCLVFFTTWCPHCKNFSRVFKDPRVVEASKDFVMIRLDKDKNQAVSKQYAPDGEYIPRTYFLSSKGALNADIHAPRPQYKYFYDEANPDSVLGGFTAAKQAFN